MALAPQYVAIRPAPDVKFNLLDTVEVAPAPGHVLYGGVRFQSDYCGVARPFTSVCEPGPDLGDISVSVDNASVATITSTGLADGTYRIVWGDGEQTAAEPEQLSETHDYTADGDGDYVVQVYRNGESGYAEVTITVTNGQTSGPYTAEMVETKVPTDGVDNVTGDPITIYHVFQCRLIGNEDGEARALRSLDLGASRAVEEGFQTVFATGAVDISGTPTDPVRSLGRLEQYAGANYGLRPVIHMDRYMATRLLEEGSIKDVGGHLETRLGSLVVAGAGYNADASLPAAVGAGNDWMYATGEVRIWKGPEKATGLVLNDPYDNEFKALVERIYIPTFECFNAAIKVTE